MILLIKLLITLGINKILGNTTRLIVSNVMVISKLADEIADNITHNGIVEQTAYPLIAIGVITKNRDYTLQINICSYTL